MAIGGGIVEISGHNARSEAQGAGGFDQQHREVAARAPAAIKCLDRSLGALGFAALIPGAISAVRILWHMERAVS